MDKKTAIEKIKKCLALSKSSEPHEAAAAMRQAQKLIEQFGIEHPECLAAGVCEDWAKSSAKTRPVRYEVALASLVARAYACELIFSRRLNAKHTDIDGGYLFIGIEPAPSVGKYTFDVLVRQLRRARRDYMATALKRCFRNKTARADEFCEGWVSAVVGTIQPSEVSPEQHTLIETYMRTQYATAKMQARQRKTSAMESLEDHLQGRIQGQNAIVNPGIGQRSMLALEGS
jgi:hypothetical protein